MSSVCGPTRMFGFRAMTPCCRPPPRRWQASDAGYFVDELDNVLHVGTKDVLRKLVLDVRLTREQLTGQFLYCAASPGRKTQQLRRRRAMLAEPGIAKAFPGADVIPDELRAALVLFVSLLDEQQRRLYAGLESLKNGRGGDRRMADLIGLDRGTIARGRRELLAQDVALDRVRRAGGGRPSVEKNAGSHRQNPGADGARDRGGSHQRPEVDPAHYRAHCH